MSADRQCCRSCGATLVRRQNGMLIFAAKVLLLKGGKARVACDCGKLAWITIDDVLD